MPIYEFVCDKCGVKVDADRPMSEAGQEEKCPCGLLMRRKFSPPHIAIKVYGRDTLLDTLNTEEKRPFVNGTPVRSKRSKDALTRGLDYVVPLEERVFTGF